MVEKVHSLMLAMPTNCSSKLELKRFFNVFDLVFYVLHELDKRPARAAYRGMSDDPLYRKALLRLAADATGAGTLARPDATGEAHNPVCGDRIGIALALSAGRITALAHRSHACVLTQASAAILAEAAVGLDRDGLAALAEAVQAMLKDGAPPPRPAYGVFDGVADHANRHKCVLLPIEAAMDALQKAEPGR
jgi:nitrogen fixation NifU-like protein